MGGPRRAAHGRRPGGRRGVGEGGESVFGRGSESGCQMLDGPAPHAVPGFVSRQLVWGAGAVGRRVGLWLRAVARAPAAGRMVRVCVSNSTELMGAVTLSVQAAP